MSLPGKSVLFVCGLFAACIVTSGCSGGGQGDVYPVALADAKAKIARTKVSYKTGTQTRWMQSAGVVADGLRIRLSNAGVLSSSCILHFEAVDAHNTRITPDCGETGAAYTDAGVEFFELEIAALVRQALTGEPVDTDKLAMEMARVAATKFPEMQAEDFAASDEWVLQQQEAAIRRAEDAEAGWAN